MAKPLPVSIPASARVSSFGETVFTTYTRLAQQHSAVNLGQGFPDFAPPEFVLEALREAALGFQQYAPLPGVPALLEAMTAKMAARLGREITAPQHVQVTVGATEALFAAMQAFVNPGDEVVVIEPFYDAYPADIVMAGGVPKFVALEPQGNDWLLDFDALEKAFTNKTRAVILNTPHNPTGKVFSAGELDRVVALAETYDALILSDEVYEHIAFSPHVSVAGRPGAWERTLTISSIGKTFSVTGWKIGWVVGPETLITPLRRAHQWIPFAVATPLQVASARILGEAETNGYYTELASLFRHKRDLLLAQLRETPFGALEPQGGYFVIADSSALGYKDDVALCNALPERAGVVAIPPSAFYSEAHKPLAKQLVRFAYCKSDEAILEAGRRLQGLL
jgi:aspartate/methionine/tyrosine aminotransferase